MNIINLILPAFMETLYMISVSLIFTLILGTPLGILLVITDTSGLMPCPPIHGVLSIIINAGRSIPFVILMIAIMPFTKFIIGTSIGTTASIVPLIFASIPFYARIIESALLEVPKGVIEASISMGTPNIKIITHVLLRESRSQIILGTTITLIAQIGYSAMAGTIGGGGLGDIAIRFGYQRSQMDVLALSVLVLILLVGLIQFAGNKFSNKYKH